MMIMMMTLLSHRCLSLLSISQSHSLNSQREPRQCYWVRQIRARDAAASRGRESEWEGKSPSQQGGPLPQLSRMPIERRKLLLAESGAGIGLKWIFVYLIISRYIVLTHQRCYSMNEIILTRPIWYWSCVSQMFGWLKASWLGHVGHGPPGPPCGDLHVIIGFFIKTSPITEILSNSVLGSTNEFDYNPLRCGWQNLI